MDARRTRMVFKAGFLWLLCAWALLAMTTSGYPNVPPRPEEIAGRVDNAFGFNLLRAVQSTKAHGNVVISPVSAAIDLTMALNGASGETAKEMSHALSLHSFELAQVNEANRALIETLRSPVKDVTLSVADSLWTDHRRVTLKPEFVSAARHWYDAEIEELDFGSPQTPARINGWVDKQTRGKIRHLVDSITPDEVALLLNAIYFKGLWAHKFDKANTHQSDFTLADGAAKKLPRMSQSGQFAYFETSDMQAIRLPYGYGQIAMYVILPATSSSLAQLESNLTPANWSKWQAQFSLRKGRIELPRFELKNSYDLNEPLQQLGMVRAFERTRAEFTRMTASRVAISSVRQLTYLKVDEEGTEAAAVTSIGVTAAVIVRQPPPFVMIVNRPFLCAIEDHRTGAVLFLGAIYDPE